MMCWPRTLGAAFICILIAQTALGDAPTRSVRPIARPVGNTTYAVRETSVPVYYHATIRPRPRPLRDQPTAHTITNPSPIVTTASRHAVAQSPRPRKRPKNLVRHVQLESARAPQAAPVASTRRKGSVCGDRSIRGQAIARIKGSISGCGVANPVEVTAIDGVLLSQPAIMDCTTAKALKSWVHNGAKPAVGRLGGGIRSLRVAAHYACRTRNSQAGGKISEHGKGRAIDISAIELNNGVSLVVLDGWKTRKQGKILKRMHKAACGPFGTVLGPDSDRFHKDHFHFDTARHRNGSYCR